MANLILCLIYSIISSRINSSSSSSSSGIKPNYKCLFNYK